mgnify:CR=1 FL=1
MMFLNIAGGTGAGMLSDRFSRKNMLAMVYFVRGCAYILLLTIPGTASLWAFASVAGFSWIATIPPYDLVGRRRLWITKAGNDIRVDIPLPSSWRGRQHPLGWVPVRLDRILHHTLRYRGFAAIPGGIGLFHHSRAKVLHPLPNSAGGKRRLRQLTR